MNTVKMGLSSLKTASPLRFSSQFVFDLGTSNATEGHLRLQTLNDKGEKVGDLYDGPLRPGGFDNGEDLVWSLAKQILQARRENAALLGRRDTIDRIVGFVPGGPQHAQLANISNLQSKTGDAPKHLNFNDLRRFIGSEVWIDPKCPITLFNDMAGGAVDAAKQLYADPAYQSKLTPGTHAVYINTGGACGHKDIYFEEQARAMVVNRPLLSLPAEELYWKGGSVSSLIRIFAENLDLKESDVNNLVRMGDGKMLTDFEIASHSIPNLTPENFNQAACQTINQYVETMSTLCFEKAKDGATIAVLGGPVAQGISDYLEQLPEPNDFSVEAGQSVSKDPQKSLLSKLVENKTLEHLQNNGWTHHPFEVLTQPEIQNNTEGWRLLLQSDRMGEDMDGKWYTVPLEGSPSVTVPPLDIPRKDPPKGYISSFQPTLLDHLQSLVTTGHLAEAIQFAPALPQPSLVEKDAIAQQDFKVQQYFETLLDSDKTKIVIQAAERQIDRSAKPEQGPHADRYTDTLHMTINGKAATLTHIKNVNYRVDAVYHQSNFDSEDHQYTLAFNNLPGKATYTYTRQRVGSYRQDEKAVLSIPTVREAASSDSPVVLFKAFQFFRACLMDYEQDWGDQPNPGDERVSTNAIRHEDTEKQPSLYDPTRPAN